ncbi:Starch-binding associating with outer membrane [Fodinibius roseus]|uniref:Starch-binding associating with outer membrane n=1 Tax=Fodinibius roseus TaxID=1194090 RepID=A0A1M4ZMQ8_9BACT|nr:RagB/SusD family nutrient uptake outer membrane protein [Fodinibius roseus]SHF19329.1 Starch-binding associating with outer membrane [Fodinibius roseus]
MNSSETSFSTKLSFMIMSVLMITSAGCTDSFLDVTPEDTLAPGNFYQNEEDAVAAAYSVYERLGTPDLYNMDGVMFILANASDQAQPPGVDASRAALNQYEVTALNPITSAWWRASFQIINRANAVTDNVPDIDMDSELRASIVGEARFLRALTYFNLVRMFGKVPIITRETKSFEELNKPRAPVDSVYAQITRDLEQAEQVLPVSYDNANEGRATVGAAKTLLAKVYLTRERWQDAAEKAQEVMNSGTYSLFEDYRHLFLPEFENGREHIFSIQFHAGEQNAGKQGRFWTYTAPSAQNTNGWPVAAGGSSYGISFPETNYYEEYPDDYRKEVNFFSEWTFEKRDTTVTFKPHFFKYYDPGQTNAKRSSVNFPLYRYAEVLLIYAEAVNEANGGPTPQAYKAVNSVRQRARFEKPDSVLPDLSGLTQEQFRQAVARERNWEFAGESKRWFDLKRTGRLMEELRADGKDIQEHHRLFPIPNLDLDLNPDWEQNPGY